MLIHQVFDSGVYNMLRDVVIDQAFRLRTHLWYAASAFSQTRWSSDNLIYFRPSIQEVIDYGANVIETYGLDQANMSPLTCTGVIIDLIFISGMTGAVLLGFRALITK